ncbi:MAG: SDR family oxidoreductase [Dehalococcoidia bacterium]|nr:MAG: SDR family oxidoreductase [Dehalococcoidia bacterium]
MIARDFSVEGKVAIVTGGGRGIGKAIALTLAEAGVDITVVARTRKQIEQVAGEVRQRGRKALAVAADVTEEEQVKGVVEKTLTQFGRIDILVNNAGIDTYNKPVAFIAGAKAPGWETTGGNWKKPLTLVEWRRVIDTNLTSAFLFCQAVGPHFLKQKRGKVINISSNSAELGAPYCSEYCASKAGLSAFTRCLASEWAPFNICVNAIGPGDTNTEMMAQYMKDPEVARVVLSAIPAGRLAEPREIALLALYLASEASNFMNGQTVYIDGGQLGRGAGL